MTNNIDWNNLGFSIHKTKSYLKYTWKNGTWNQGEYITDPEITLSVYASALHYGQTCFEGLKAFTCKDGKVRIFRPELNALRLQKSCHAVSMPSPSVELFIEACEKLVRDNVDWVPPYGSDGSMYLRPFVFGSGAVLGLQASPEYYFMVLGNPVGSYYKGGLTPCNALIQYGFDRAAPFGMVLYILYRDVPKLLVIMDRLFQSLKRQRKRDLM
jgi:branched-chain amino acid aminotransferase